MRGGMSKQLIVDPAAAYDRLRTETAAMFGFDVSNLTLTQGLQLDLVSLLRLEVDSMHGAVLAGETVDLKRLEMAHDMLQKLLPDKALVAPAPAPDVGEHGAAVFQVETMINGLLRAREHADVKRTADLMWREEQAAILAAGGDVLAAVAPSVADGGRAQSGAGVSHPSGPPPSPPLTSEQKMERANNNRQPPAHYLRGEPEEWRRHIGADGSIIAPYFVPHG
jgi:hypothetical protein